MFHINGRTYPNITTAAHHLKRNGHEQLDGSGRVWLNHTTGKTMRLQKIQPTANNIQGGPMPKFKLIIDTTISSSIVVDAETAEDAKATFYAREYDGIAREGETVIHEEVIEVVEEAA